MRLALIVLFLGLLVKVNAFGSNYWKFKTLVEEHLESKHRARIKSTHFPGVSPYDMPRFIRQPLDHFDPHNQEGYSQRFWVNSEYWKPIDGPIFLYIGGEWSIRRHEVESGALVKYAKTHKALIFVVEHRFYGQSLNDDGLQTKNLKYLSTQQALADLASFHLQMSMTYKLTEKNKWISFGGSYPGCLSAWFRIKYPHLVQGAIASSPPVRAEMNFYEYNGVVGRSLASVKAGGSQKCFDMVKDSFRTVNYLVKKGKLAKLSDDFKTCVPAVTYLDAISLASNLAYIFMGIVQYNNIYTPSFNIKAVCEVMTQETDAYRNLIAMNQHFLNGDCSDYSWDSYMKSLSNETFDRKHADSWRQWMYQTCAEFGFFHTCYGKDCPFARSMKLHPHYVMCKSVYNVDAAEVYERVDLTNSYYGSDQPRGSNILFINGLIDPWSSLSVLEDISDSELAIVIPDTSHCSDLRDDDPNDPPTLRAAREKISDQIGRWLSEPHAESNVRNRTSHRKESSTFQNL